MFAKEIAINSFTNLLFLGKNDKGEIKMEIASFGFNPKKTELVYDVSLFKDRLPLVGGLFISKTKSQEERYAKKTTYHP